MADFPEEWRLLAGSSPAACVGWSGASQQRGRKLAQYSATYLAVHRQISTGLLAVLAVWHNHRVAPRGLHQGQSPLQRSGFSAIESDWLVALGYPPATGDAGTCHLVTLEQEEALVA